MKTRLNQGVFGFYPSGFVAIFFVCFRQSGNSLTHFMVKSFAITFVYRAKVTFVFVAQINGLAFNRGAVILSVQFECNFM